MVDRKQHKRMSAAGFREYTFKADSSNRYVRFINNGKPRLVLLHGYGSSGVGQYFRVARELSKDFDIILPDLLHNGRSTGTTNDFSIDAQTEHLKQILDSLGVMEPVTVIGNSYGGIVASYFAEKFPARVAALGIYDSPVLHYSSAFADSLAKSLGVGDIRNLLSPRNVFENKVSLDIVFHDQPYIPRFLRKQMVKYGTLPVRERQIKLLEYLIDNETSFNRHQFNWPMPVYILWGEYDRLIPIEVANGIIGDYKIPESRIFIFKDAAHAANVEHPDEFVGAVRRMMNDQLRIE